MPKTPATTRLLITRTLTGLFALLLAGASGGLAATVLVVVAMLVLVPWPGRTRAPAVVAYASPQVVRAETPGFVVSLAVSDGQAVSDGDLLLELERDRSNRRVHNREGCRLRRRCLC